MLASKEDVFNFVHLASAEDSQVLHSLLKRYHSQKTKSPFRFGPIVMRYYYSNGQPVEALKAFCDPDLDGLFEDLSSLKLLMSLLYEHNMHSEIKDVFEVVKSKKSGNPVFVKTLSNIVLASCYKQNTPESYKLATEIGRQDKEHVTRRGVEIAAAVALKQRDPGLALELLTAIDFSNNLLTRNLKILAYSSMDRPEEALRIIKRDLFRDIPTNVVPEAMKAMKEAVYRIKDDNQKDFVVPELKNLEADLREKGFLVEKSLDTHLLEPISGVKKRQILEESSESGHSDEMNG
ncbi:pentatricopeptide repeat-containing protein 2, mitochondrial-like isoform X2 [Artemia franciscana]|nr:hypothetical protein QYM36_001196 [Artemia franciscana]KAK2724625.1 hypothetical protein QYM36_001196 [Artemia franciscana]